MGVSAYRSTEQVVLFHSRSRINKSEAAYRPGLLLESIFRHVPAAREELAALFPQADIDAMVQVQSWNTATMFDCFVTVPLCSPVAL